MPDTLKRWDVLHQQLLYDASPWLKLSSEHVRLPNGVEIPDFYRIDMASYVIIFAVDTQDRVAMVEHYKHGPQQVSMELPAGYIEPGDDPLASAQRELQEEAGMVSDAWSSLGSYFIDGNRGCGWMHAFLARHARITGQTAYEPTELIQLHFKPLDAVYNLWQAGQITNATAMAVIGRALLQIGYLGRTNG